MDAFPEYRKEVIFSYDKKKYPFVDLVQQMYETTEALEFVHKLDENASKAGYIEFGNDQGTFLHKKFYNSPLFEDFKILYRQWIAEVIGIL